MLWRGEKLELGASLSSETMRDLPTVWKTDASRET